jgi:hypothetical protein
MKNQKLLNEYFAAEWVTRPNAGLEKYEYSGPALIDKVQLNEWVLDVGCGDNYFKGKIKNLVGIDPANDNADVKVSIEDYKTDQLFDVAFCLGSINFGDSGEIVCQIMKVSQLLKPNGRIYWRCNPGKQDHETEGCKNIKFFNWTEHWHNYFADALGFTVVTVKQDTHDRLYAEWVRLDTYLTLATPY